MRLNKKIIEAGSVQHFMKSISFYKSIDDTYIVTQKGRIIIASLNYTIARNVLTDLLK
jgi:hypothetical protein